MDIETEIDRARTLHRQGNAAAAIPVYQAVLREYPDHPEALHLLGVAALQGGNPEQALDLIGRAADLAPENPKIQNNLGTALLLLGRVAEATDRYRKAGKLDTTFSEPRFNLGNALGAAGKVEEAEQAYREALKIDPTHAAASNNLAAIHKARGDFLAALELYRDALRNAPRSVEFRTNLVLVLEELNRVEEAAAVAQELVLMAPDFPVARLARARLDRRAGRLKAAQDGLRTAIDSGPPAAVMAPLLYEMALVLDQLGDYGGAFEVCTRAKAARRSLPEAASWDLAHYPAEVERHRTWFTVERIASIPEVPEGGAARPAFFVGFPRSGTTLMEQILGSHPGFATTGERTPLHRVFLETESRLHRSVVLPEGLETLTPDEIVLLRKGFFEISDQVIGEELGNRILLDKLPLNIIRLGVANWLFPNGRVIVALRDPRDVVLSCYMQNFHINRAMQQFQSLQSTARFYAGVMELWLQWRELLSMPWYVYRYEDLVSDFDGTVSGVLDFLDVAWDTSVERFAEHARAGQINTPSYASVTQPIYNRSAGRWRNYADQLAPILPVLEPFVREFGYDPE